MIISMTPEEFTQLRNFVKKFENNKVTKSFNNVFDKNSTSVVKGFANPISKEIIINIPEEQALQVEKVLVKHSASLGKLATNGISITSAPRWISTLKEMLNDVLRAFHLK